VAAVSSFLDPSRSNVLRARPGGAEAQTAVSDQPKKSRSRGRLRTTNLGEPQDVGMI
jgi:hypothetical protein